MIPKTETVPDLVFAEQPTNTLKLRNETRTIAGYIDGLEAMKQAIYIILSVERYKYPIHSRGFGVELLDLFGQPTTYVLPEIKRRIQVALLQDSRILSVDNFEFTVERNKVYTTFTASTEFGEVNAERAVDV